MLLLSLRLLYESIMLNTGVVVNLILCKPTYVREYFFRIFIAMYNLFTQFVTLLHFFITVVIKKKFATIYFSDFWSSRNYIPNVHLSSICQSITVNPKMWQFFQLANTEYCRSTFIGEDKFSWFSIKPLLRGFRNSCYWTVELSQYMETSH